MIHIKNGRKYLRIILGNLKSDRLYKKYSLIEKIGAGKFSSVYKAFSKKSGNKYAVKIIEKSKLTSEELGLLKNETSIMKILNHPGLLSLHESFETLEAFYHVIELVEGLDLYQYIIRHDFLEEIEVSKIMKKLLLALFQLHNIGIVHRDLKAENVMLGYDMDEDGNQSSREWKNLKIIDFGLACYSEELVDKQILCGTLSYISPELLRGHKATFSSDIWSLGIIFYFLLKGELPFFSETNEVQIKRILEEDLNLQNDPFFINVSPEAKDLLNLFLKKDHLERITVENALKHDFIEHPENLSNYIGSNREKSFNIDKILNN